MHILILSLVFPPDSVSTAEIMGDLAADLHALGHDLTVLTTTPHYNRDEQAERNQPMRSAWGPLLKRSDYHGIAVYHAVMPAKGKSVLLRLMGWAGFHVLSTVAGLTIATKPDVIVAPSPPLSIGVSAWLISRLRGAPFVYNVQEIYPDIAINLGALRNGTLIALLSHLERFVYRKAAAISVIAARMRQRLIAKGVPDQKIHVIPNFVDLDRLAPVDKDNAFARAHGIARAFAVTYAGNMGPAQGLEVVIDAASLLSDLPDVKLLLIGEGMRREKLAEAAARRAPNVTVLPYQPNSMMPQIYGASDVCLVAQAPSTASDAIPSKVYRIMASARPIIAITEPNSDLAALVRDAGCGAVVAAGAADRLAETIRSASSDRVRWREMGERGRRFVVEHYGRRTVSAQYEALVRSLVASAEPARAS